MIEAVITEIDLESDNYKHLRYIHVDIDGGKDFCYRGRVSSDAFFNNYKKERNKTKTRLYTRRDKWEWEMSQKTFAKSCKRCGAEMPEVEEVTVGSIWEFYELIGYDYKTKKYKES